MSFFLSHHIIRVTTQYHSPSSIERREKEEEKKRKQIPPKSTSFHNLSKITFYFQTIFLVIICSFSVCRMISFVSFDLLVHFYFIFWSTRHDKEFHLSLSRHILFIDFLSLHANDSFKCTQAQDWMIDRSTSRRVIVSSSQPPPYFKRRVERRHQCEHLLSLSLST